MACFAPEYIEFLLWIGTKSDFEVTQSYKNYLWASLIATCSWVGFKSRSYFPDLVHISNGGCMGGSCFPALSFLSLKLLRFALIME